MNARGSIKEICFKLHNRLVKVYQTFFIHAYISYVTHLCAHDDTINAPPFPWALLIQYQSVAISVQNIV